MVAASRARPSDAARISATPQKSDTKNPYSCSTPRSLGLTGARPPPAWTMFISTTVALLGAA